MASNYDDVLQQLRGAGLKVEHLIVGKLQRCALVDDRERRGWYTLHELRTDEGDDLLVGGYGVWQGADNNARKIELRKRELTREQREAFRKRLADDRRRADKARQAEADKAAARAAQVWRTCTESGESDYLARKGVAAHGVRYSPSGSLVIPMLDVAGKIHGLQVIRSKAAQASGRRREKEYWPAGLVTKGHFHLIGMVDAVVLVAEGYATAASLYEATGLPVAVAFDANNLAPVACELRKRYKRAKVLICADDDNTQRCRACRERVWLSDGPTCGHCGKPHEASNAGVSQASLAAMAVDGAWIVPAFADPEKLRSDWITSGSKLNDYNDLHVAEGLHVVRAQVEARLLELGWRASGKTGRAVSVKGGGVDNPDGPVPLRPIETLDELLERYALVYGQGGTVFDHQEHVLLALSDMRDACLTRELHRTWAEHPDKRIVRVSEVGFDPACADPAIRCNLWAGWPTAPKAGNCDKLLELLRYMCEADGCPEELYDWVIQWLAYPIQHPGAKMKSTLVIHGPQGTGKNMFFEAYMSIFGRYGRVIDQSAIEDKFNDWASRKLFLIADEVVARSDLYHVKNRLKAFITGEWIRINPKNMAAYEERNHVNMVFLSNEAMPVVLEEDDRRHAVIWTPEKLSHSFYQEVLAEIRQGGIEALHHHLLHLNLAGFTEGALPPMTDAKRELIGLSQDSPSRFIHAFEAGDLDGFPAKASSVGMLLPALSTDLYQLYCLWCARLGLKALNLPRFSNAAMRKHGAVTERKRYDGPSGVKGPAAMVTLPGAKGAPPGESEVYWLGERVRAFQQSLKDFRVEQR